MIDTPPAGPPPGSSSEGEIPPVRGGKPFRILFVCTGNTCRSPLAEALARRALERRGWREVEVRSAGVAATPGAPASEGSLRAGGEEGLELDEHRARPLTADLVAWADLILTMSPSHLGPVAMAGGSDRAEAITSFVSEEEGEEASGVSDPFGGDLSRYRETLRELDTLVEGVLRRLEPVLAP